MKKVKMELLDGIDKSDKSEEDSCLIKTLADPQHPENR